MRRTTVMIGIALCALAGCSSAPDPGPVFNDEGQQAIGCMVHQAEAPGARYTDPAMRNTGQILGLMRYYTANGSKPYCDGAPATENDRAWARTYVDLGGAPARLTTVQP